MVFHRGNFSILRSLDTELDDQLALSRMIFKAVILIEEEKKEHRWNFIENHLEIASTTDLVDIRAYSFFMIHAIHSFL